MPLILKPFLRLLNKDMNMDNCIYAGKYINFLKLGSWEFVKRSNCSGAVVVVAITNNNELIFVEQFRIPINSYCIEFPAGLVGDENEDETIVQAAYKELIEEAGYAANNIKDFGVFYSSPGLADEEVNYCLATNLEKVSDGGGVGNEDIKVHIVPSSRVSIWLSEQRGLGKKISSNVAAGLSFGLIEMLNRSVENLPKV